MEKQSNRKRINLINVLSDALIVFLSYIFAMYLRFTALGGDITVDPMQPKLLIAVAILALLMSVCYLAYKSSYVTVILVNAIGTLLIMALFFVYRLTDFSRLSLVLFWIVSSALVIAKHALGHKIISSYYGKHRIIVVGSKAAADCYVADTENEICGFVSPAEEAGCLGCIENLNEIVENSKADEIVISLAPEHAQYVKTAIEIADREGIYLSMVPFYSEYIPAHPEIESFGKTKVINLRATPLDNIINASVKRLGDIIGSLLLIILTSPLMLICAIGVKLSSPGPVFFKQERVGKDRQNFNMFKFRSMRVNTEENTAWSKDSDPRRTKFGSFIRKYSLDELPQFFNVLSGNMSLVGPRPEIPFYVHQFKETVPLYLVRQQVRPGITGWAQVNGFRGDTSIETRVEYDIWYIENWSLALDIKILFSTVFGGKFKNNEK